MTKLLTIVAPDRAYFGRKDAQQLAVVRRLAADLDLPVEIVPVETVREPDGLAMSSRNAYLTPAERAEAPGLHRALLAGRALAADGARAPSSARSRRACVIGFPSRLPWPPTPTTPPAAARFAVDYVAVVDPDSFAPVDEAAAVPPAASSSPPCASAPPGCSTTSPSAPRRTTDSRHPSIEPDPHDGPHRASEGVTSVATVMINGRRRPPCAKA